MDIYKVNQMMSSMVKVNRRIEYYGTADIKKLAVLDMIYNLIDCNPELEHECLLKLEAIADKMVNTSPDICKYRGETVFLEDSKSTVSLLKTINNAPSISGKSMSLVTGSIYEDNVIVNSELNDATGWIAGSVTTIENGVAKIVWAGGSVVSVLSQSVDPLIVGETYRMTYTIKNFTDGDPHLVSGVGSPALEKANGSHEIIFEAAYAQFTIGITNPGPHDFEIDDIKVYKRVETGLNDIYTFSEDEFKIDFTDPNGDLPDKVRIVSLPTTGTLYYNELEISQGFIFEIENANLLTYKRENSEYVDSFIFQTSDDNEINKLFSNMATFTINVEGEVNQPPTVGDGSTTTAHDTAVTFTRAMFTTATTPPYSDPEGDAALTLKITSLPSKGTIKNNGVAISVNDTFDFTTVIDAGLLTYSPDPTETEAHVPSFNFQIADAGSGQFVG